MEQPNPYSQEQVNNASQDAVRQAEKATANAETVSSKTPQLIDIVSSTFDDVDAALKKQQELMPQQIEVAKRRDKIATKLNTEATEAYKDRVLSPEAQKRYEQARATAQEAEREFQEKQRMANEGNPLEKFWATLTMDMTRKKLATAQQQYQNVQRSQLTAVNAYATKTEANTMVANNAVAEDTINLESQQAAIDSVIKLAEKRRTNVSQVVSEYAGILGLDDKATNAFRKRVQTMEQANAANTSSVFQALQLTQSEMTLEKMRTANKKSTEDREVYRDMYETFAESRGLTEGNYTPFSEFIQRSAQENNRDPFTRNFLHHVNAKGADAVTQPYTRLNELVASGAELNNRQSKELREIGIIVQAHNANVETRVMAEMGLEEPPAPGTAEYDKFNEKVKSRMVNMGNNEDESMINQLVVSKRQAFRNDGGIAIRDGIVTIGRAEDALQSQSFKEKYLSKLPPALREDVEKGNIPENLSIDTSNYETRTEEIATSAAQRIMERIQEMDLSVTANSDEVNSMVEAEAQKIGEYYSTQEQVLKTENAFMGDLKLPDATNKSPLSGMPQSKIDITNSGEWQVLLKQRLMKLRLDSLPTNSDLDSFRAQQAQRQLNNL